MLPVRSCLRAACILFAMSASAANRVVGRLARIEEFSDVPTAIAKDIAARGCRIPQVAGIPKLHNVITGEFKMRGQKDWAVLCLTANHESRVIVYWNGMPAAPYQFASMDETITPSKNGYYRLLAVANEVFIRGHSSRAESPMPKIIDHHGIEDGISEGLCRPLPSQRSMAKARRRRLGLPTRARTCN